MFSRIAIYEISSKITFASHSIIITILSWGQEHLFLMLSFIGTQNTHVMRKPRLSISTQAVGQSSPRINTVRQKMPTMGRSFKDQSGLMWVKPTWPPPALPWLLQSIEVSRSMRRKKISSFCQGRIHSPFFLQDQTANFGLKNGSKIFLGVF